MDFFKHFLRCVIQFIQQQHLNSWFTDSVYFSPWNVSQCFFFMGYRGFCMFTGSHYCTLVSICRDLIRSDDVHPQYHRDDNSTLVWSDIIYMSLVFLLMSRYDETVMGKISDTYEEQHIFFYLGRFKCTRVQEKLAPSDNRAMGGKERCP